jgi:hypothetical protein
MDSSAGAVGERSGTRSRLRAALGRQVRPRQVLLSAGFAWLISVIVLHFTLASVATVTAFLDVVFQLAALGVLIAASMASLPLGRRLAGYAVVALLTTLLASLPGRLSVTADVLALLVAVIAAAAAVKQKRSPQPWRRPGP